MPPQARPITSWATSPASSGSPSRRSSSMKRRSAYAPDSCSKASMSLAWARARRLASAAAAAASAASGSGERLPRGDGVTRSAARAGRRPRPGGPGRRSSRARERPPARPAPGPRRPGRAARAGRARSPRSPARGGPGGGGHAGSDPPRRSARDDAATTVGRRHNPSRLPSHAAVLLLVCRRLERQRAGVDAVPVAGRGRAVVEDVAEGTATAAADDIGAAHEGAVVLPQLDRLGDGGLGEARPAGARVELGVRAEQLAAAAGAPGEAIGVVVDVLTGERPLGVGLAQHAVLHRGQLLAPLLGRLGDLAGDVGGVGLAHLWFLPIGQHLVRPASPQNDFRARGLGGDALEGEDPIGGRGRGAPGRAPASTRARPESPSARRSSPAAAPTACSRNGPGGRVRAPLRPWAAESTWRSSIMLSTPGWPTRAAGKLATTTSATIGPSQRPRPRAGTATGGSRWMPDRAAASDGPVVSIAGSATARIASRSDARPCSPA